MDRELEKVVVKGTSEKLETASPEILQLRKQIMVEKLMKSNHNNKHNPKVEEVNSNVEDKECIKITPKPIMSLGPSSVLSRAKIFLPLMKTETEKLLQQAEENPASVSLEIDPDAMEDDVDGQLVEMNLALIQSQDEDDSSDSDVEEESTEQKNNGQSPNKIEELTGSSNNTEAET